MLIGEFEGKLTDKNRLAIPSKIRNELKDDLILSRGYEGCLILLDQKRWKSLIDLVSRKPLLQLNTRDTKRYLIGGAYELELDSQRRFVLPQSLKNFAEITEDLIFLAIMDWVEIWSKERWERKLLELTKSASDIADKLMEDL